MDYDPVLQAVAVGTTEGVIKMYAPRYCVFDRARALLGPLSCSWSRACIVRLGCVLSHGVPELFS